MPGASRTKSSSKEPLWSRGPAYDARWTGLPAKWTQLFASLHKDRDLSDRMSRRELLLGLGAAGDETWNELWRHGFPTTALGAAGDAYFCGYSKEELQSTDKGIQRGRTAYVRWLLLVLFICLRRVVAEDVDQQSPHYSGMQAATCLVQTRIRQLWTALWEIRMPFLQPSTANETDETANIVGGSYSLYYCVYGCMSITDTIIRSIHRQSQPGPTPSTPHILQLVAWIWIHSDQHRLRICALEALGGSPDLDTDLVPSLRAPPPLQHTDMLATLCRDLADRAVRDGPLCTAYRLLRVLLPVRASGTVDIAPAVFARVLAAYRRQHCAGAPDPVWRARVSHWHFFYVASAVQTAESTPACRIPEEQLYAIISALARWLVPAVAGADAPWPGDDGVPSLAATLMRVGRLLGTHTPKRRLAPLRRYTYSAWRASVAELDGRHALRDLPQWCEPLAVWRRLGRLMPPDARDDGAHVIEERTTGVLERCQWRECACHVLRPAHPLKVCKGCWVVAYCSDKCQTSDWEQGEHRSACRRRDK